MSRHIRFVLLLAIFGAFPALALELAGVQVPTEVTVEGRAMPLVLNGAGVRKKFFFSIYVGALYLPGTMRDAAAILSGPTANRVAMHFVYDHVSREKLDDAWREGFAANLSDTELAALAPRLAQFTGLFRDMAKGDRIWLDHLPGEGTRVSINGEPRGTIAGTDFNLALLKIWVGERPVTSALKNAMLGVDKP